MPCVQRIKVVSMQFDWPFEATRTINVVQLFCINTEPIGELDLLQTTLWTVLQCKLL